MTFLSCGIENVKVLFATVAAVRQGKDGLTSDLASARYRALIPAMQLARLGHEVQVASLPPGGWPQDLLNLRFDTAIISKSFHIENEKLASSLRENGARIVVDFCDDHFTHPQFGPHCHRLAELADQVVASTEAMAEAVARHTAKSSIVISDPVEGSRGTALFSPRFPNVRILWFGHPVNLDSLWAKAGQLVTLSKDIPIQFTIVTQPGNGLEAQVRTLFGSSAPRLRVKLVPWSTEATWRALEECDLVWIPVIDSERKTVKSPNRLIEPLWAGRFVVADPLPSYLPFGSHVSLGSGLAEGVEAALADTAAVETRIRNAQRQIGRHHSAYACGQQWNTAIGDSIRRPLRLNLGCGDKILPGYINVDVAASRAGMKPDLLCDLRDLAALDDNSVDEILSVHVVEHFWRWEVTDILREWIRVLKPGAAMIIECPNLESACRTFLDDPVQHARMDRSGQRTMWVFYGDPAWKDPLMNHRWGYTPASLQALLAETGLVDIRQEPAQFKLREPRDMRIVGIKPGTD